MVDAYTLVASLVSDCNLVWARNYLFAKLHGGREDAYSRTGALVVKGLCPTVCVANRASHRGAGVPLQEDRQGRTVGLQLQASR